MALRLLAVLVTAVLLGGAGGAADVDALLFHGAAGRAAPATPHFEAAGRTGHHADQCLLALRLATGTRAAPIVLPRQFESLPTRGGARRPAAAPERHDPALHQESRAPPSVLA
ncbi:MAG TPA: hypothetical protein VEH83_01640 [Gemmatimonadales bacterium]|nr:hypothetical protein [Gemmatimonadales bacterium]